MAISCNTGFVYKWTNKINNRWYIGSHRGTPDDGYVASSIVLKLAMKKYTTENFEREILYTGADFREVEAFLLEEFNAASDPMSYNLKNTAAGGNGGANKGQLRTVETKQKISAANKGRLTGDKNPSKRPEVREKLRISNTGKKHSEETKDKLSRINAGQFKGLTHSEIYGEENALQRKLAMSGENNPAKREEVRKKISVAMANRPFLCCPHCRFESQGTSAMQRWHFDNCKSIILP